MMKRVLIIEDDDNLTTSVAPRGGNKVISECQRAGFTPAEARYVPNPPSMAI